METVEPKAQDNQTQEKPAENTTSESNEVKVETPVQPPKKQSGRKRRHINRAQVHILCTYNNTIVSMTDLNGNSLGWSSSGSLGFKGSKKSTPYAATLVAQKVVEKTARYGIKEVDIFIKGVGGGREASIRAIGNAGLQINFIKDVTPTPHNGCRPPKPRRV